MAFKFFRPKGANTHDPIEQSAGAPEQTGDIESPEATGATEGQPIQDMQMKYTGSASSPRNPIDTATDLKDILSGPAFQARKVMVRVESAFLKFREALKEIQELEQDNREELQNIEEEVNEQQNVIRGCTDNRGSGYSYEAIAQANGKIKELQVTKADILAMIEQSGTDRKLLEDMLSSHHNKVQQAVDGQPEGKQIKIGPGKRDVHGAMKALSQLPPTPQTQPGALVPSPSSNEFRLLAKARTSGVTAGASSSAADPSNAAFPSSYPKLPPHALRESTLDGSHSPESFNNRMIDLTESDED
ncbi:hypothetical protein BU23DRAFT_554925 [Bimuria novae-zelandiae CBS 107.79]|uniref:Uncharacterized protein n=1 Tax=Bimuria novae-zelandiae CBS 107.79 TaxID=1447943 RepID=A0A6A5V6J5_9PLEO|nr:hypothetical protein BU23DRAFT_554925 [Bimuria novae-zelandiae CBS 107.79]